MATPKQVAYAQMQLDVQVQIDLIALRYGLHPGDLRVEWDGGKMEMITGTHDLVISASHGAWSVTVPLDHDALMRHDEQRWPRLFGQNFGFDKC